MASNFNEVVQARNFPYKYKSMNYSKYLIEKNEIIEFGKFKKKGKI